MKRSSVGHLPCSIARSLDVVGEWWTPLILRDIFAGKRRFEEIQADLGIARNILSDRLSTLVERGLLERRKYQESPDRYEYRLTEMGVDFFPVLVALVNWGDRWFAGEAGPPVRYEHEGHDGAEGHDARPVLVCGTCGEPLNARNMSAHRGPGWRPGPPGTLDFPE